MIVREDEPDDPEDEPPLRLGDLARAGRSAFGVSGDGGGTGEPRALLAGSWTMAAWLVPHPASTRAASTPAVAERLARKL